MSILDNSFSFLYTNRAGIQTVLRNSCSQVGTQNMIFLQKIIKDSLACINQVPLISSLFGYNNGQAVQLLVSDCR